mgnify:CR=1 FL=1
MLLGQETKLTQKLYATAAAHPQRVVFAEAVHPTMLKAAVQAKAEGICHPILLGNDEVITKMAQKLDLNLDGIEIVNLRHPSEQERRERYAMIGSYAIHRAYVRSGHRRVLHVQRRERPPR